MDKNKILEAARNNGDRGNEYEYNISDRASILTLISITLVVLILSIIEYFSRGLVNLGFIIIGATTIATDTLYKGIVYKKMWRIFVGAILTLITLILIIVWMVTL